MRVLLMFCSSRLLNTFQVICLIITSILCLASCLSTKVAMATSVKTVDSFLEEDFTQLTFVGENEAPHFSETGNEIIFTSRQRPAHKGAQVYEIDLRKNHERRVTFHDGDDSSPSYISGREIMYSSTTDEIKESPFLNKNAAKDYPPSEIYRSDNFGNLIERLTNYPGFDSEALYVKNFLKPFIVFSSRRGGISGIFKLDPKTKQVSFLVMDKDKESRYPAVSPDRKRLAWVEKDLQTDKNIIHVTPLNGKKIDLVKEGGGQFRDLLWDPERNKLYYSVLRSGESYFQLEVYDLDKKCTQVLFKRVDSLIQPTISNENKPKIAFTRLFEGKKQIYMVALPTNLGPCLEEATTTKLEK